MGPPAAHPARNDSGSAAQDLSTAYDATTDPRDLKEEEELVAGERTAVPEQPDPIGFTPNPSMDEDPYRDLRAKVEEKFSRLYNDKTVEVSEIERRRYLRSALHGEPMWFDVAFPAFELVIRVVPAPPAWSDTATQAIQLRRKDGLVGDDINSWVDNFQMYHIWLQIDVVGGEPQPWLQSIIEERDGKIPGAREMLKMLREDGPIDAIRELSAPRRHLLLSAIRIAEIRTCICMDALSDGSFFSSAGTD